MPKVAAEDNLSECYSYCKEHVTVIKSAIWLAGEDKLFKQENINYIVYILLLCKILALQTIMATSK